MLQVGTPSGRSSMKSVTLLQAVTLLLLAGPAASAQEKTDREWAIAAVQELGGWIEFDEKEPGRPIVSVDFCYLSPGDADLKYLAGLTKLRSLKLEYSLATDAGLRHLRGLTELRRLDLSQCRWIKGEGLEHLKGL